MLKATAILFFLMMHGAVHGQKQADSVDYVIYSTIIKNIILPDSRSVVVIYETNKDEYYDPWYGDTMNRQQIFINWVRFFQTPFEWEDYALYRKFDKHNEIAKQLADSSFNLPLEVYTTSKQALTKFFKKSGRAGWRKFNEKYPASGGIFEFSDIHYSPDGKKAVVYYSVTLNGLNGRGDVLIFQKFGDEWVVIHEGNLWQN